MSSTPNTAEFLQVVNTPDIAESGGGHGAKGVDFQRWWAVFRMVELETEGHSDFLLLFEAVQDVAELDSPTSPTYARLYQIKKKDRGEWTWSALTGTSAPKKSKSLTAGQPALSVEKISDSVLGKLHKCVVAFNSLPVEGYFISNAGCEIPLASGESAATSMPCSTADFAEEHALLLTEALKTLSSDTTGSLDLNKIKIKRVPIHPDEPKSQAVLAALNLLNSRSPSHSGQAAAFVESLLLKISPLGRHTNHCHSYEELLKQRGFTRTEFASALADLQTIPDYAAHVESWLNQLSHEGVDFMRITKLRVHCTRVIREQLMQAVTPGANTLHNLCDDWIDSNPLGPSLNVYFARALTELNFEAYAFSEEEALARLMLRAIRKCVDPS